MIVKKPILGLLFAVSSVFASLAHGTEGGATTYPDGLMTVMSGVLGGPGTYVFNYNRFITNSSIRDNNGNANPPGGSASIQAHAIRLLHVFDGVKLFGGDVGAEVAQPYLDGTVRLPSLGLSGGARGFADTLVGPIVGWHSPAYHQTLGLDVSIPTGSYDKNRIFNPGSNATNVQLAYAFSWLPTAQLELSSKLNVIWNAKNPATDYQSGVEFIADFGMNYHLPKGFWAGVGGYYHTQFNNDTQHGEPAFGTGNRVRDLTLGPQLGWGNPKYGVYASLQRSVYTRNTLRATQVYVNGFIGF